MVGPLQKPAGSERVMKRLFLWGLGLALALGLAYAVGSNVGVPERASAQDDCNPAYPSICIRPSEGDYDCAGSGDGPNYVVGPIDVLPPDPMGLDPDGDGIGCEEGEISAPDGPGNAVDPTATSPPAGDAAATPVAGGTTGATPTSDVEAISVNGFGPDDVSQAGPYAWLIAGLTGAGIAWLLSGLAAARLATARPDRPREPTPPPPADATPRFFVTMRSVREGREPERSRPKASRSAAPPPPLISPPPFRRRDR